MTPVFSIIGKSSSDNTKYQFLGTGFFIDNYGTFITAGHVFRKNISKISIFYICFPTENANVELFKIQEFDFISRKIYSDEDRRVNTLRDKKIIQNGPEYKDVGLGFSGLVNTPYYEFQRKRPSEQDDLKMPCFNFNKDSGLPKTFTLVNDLLESLLIEYKVRDLKLKERLRLARIPFLGNNKFIDLYNNCIEIHGIAEIGNSGAPLLKDNQKVIGLFVSGDKYNDLKVALLSRYVLKQIRRIKRKIRCKRRNRLRANA